MTFGLILQSFVWTFLLSCTREITYKNNYYNALCNWLVFAFFKSKHFCRVRESLYCSFVKRSNSLVCYYAFILFLFGKYCFFASCFYCTHNTFNIRLQRVFNNSFFMELYASNFLVPLDILDARAVFMLI